MLYFHPFPIAGRCNSKNLGSAVHRLMPAFFSSSWDAEVAFKLPLLMGLGAGGLPALLPSFCPREHRWHGDSTVLGAEKYLENVLCLSATAAWELKGRLLCCFLSPYFQASGNFPGMSITSFQNGLAGRSSYGQARKGQKLEPALYFFIKSMK